MCIRDRSVSVDQVSAKLKQISVLNQWSWQLTKLGAQNVLEYSCPGFNGSPESVLWRIQGSTSLKLADVLPLPKGKSIEDFNKDLRPISLTSMLSKVAEGFVIEKDIKPVLLKCIDPNQYGFIPNSCTTFAHILMLHHWLGATDGSGSHVRVALLDYKKAFWPCRSQFAYCQTLQHRCKAYCC